MASETQVVEGTVIEVQPNSLVKLSVPHGGVVMAHVASDARSVIVRILPGDRVLVELSPYHPGRGRIVGVSNKGAKQ